MEEIDEAFNWLVLILTALAGALLQYPSLYPTFATMKRPEIYMMRTLLVPLAILIISWLSSHMIQNREIKIILKCFSWLYALIVLMTDLALFIGGIFNVHIFGVFGVVILFVIMPIISFSIYMHTIRERYKLMFPDSKFLNSNKKQVLFCLIVIAFAIVQVPALAVPPPQGLFCFASKQNKDWFRKF